MAVPADSREVVVGVIGRAHGVHGEVTIAVRTDEPERRFAAGQVLRAEDGPALFTVRASRDHSGRLLVAFAEVSDRTTAEAVRGTRLVADVPLDEQPSGEGEFYDRQLIGLAVRTPAGAPIGTVRGVAHLPAQDLLEVEIGDQIRLVPFVAAIVPHVDLQGGFLEVADVVGLLDDAD